jgi:hypothetical protein
MRESLKIKFSSLCGVARKNLLLTYNTYAAAQFFGHALPSLENWIFRGSHE